MPDDIASTGQHVFGGSRRSTAPDASTLGVMLPTFGLIDGTIHPAQISSAAVYAEQHGLDGLWLADHLLHPLPVLESVVTLEHIASVTRHVRIGTAVMLLALRQTIVAAKQLATIAAYHPGRLTVGVGAGGEHPMEFAAAGVPLEGRGDRMAAAVEECRALWRGDPFQGAEPHGGGRISPRPPQIPLLFGGHTAKALRRAARLGDGWVGFYKDVDGFAAARALLTRERETAGLEPDSFPTGMLLPTLVMDRDDGAVARAAAFMHGASNKDFRASPDRFVLAGTPDRILQRLADYHGAGCRHFILAVRDVGPAYMDQLAVVCAEILPGLASF
jgi:alkanesulfonate monooxygenase SsuD/methylene tetrahydromethanopterin reductase-like flavin-dependent oxidoreductase (luciferase family)